MVQVDNTALGSVKLFSIKFVVESNKSNHLYIHENSICKNFTPF